MRHRADRRAEVLSRSRRRDGPPGPIIVGCAVRDRRLSFLWGAGTANGADAFAGKTGRAAAEGGRSRDDADGFVASMIDGGAGAFYCTGLRPRIPTVQSKNRNYFWAV